MNPLRRWFECRFVRGAIHAYLDGEAPRAGARIEAHLAQCAHCRALAQALRAQSRAIESLSAEEEPSAGFVNRVMERVATAESVRAPIVRRQRTPAVAAVATAAAVIVIALTMWALFPRPTPSVVEPASRTPKIAREEDAPRQALVQAPPAVPAPTADRTVTRKPAPTGTPRRIAAERPAPAQEHRDLGRAYEDEGQLDEALEEYVTARDEGGSQMARLDVARVYEKTGHTAEAVDELIQVAFAEVDETTWEALSVD